MKLIALRFWLDTTDETILMGCTECPEFRHLVFTIADARSIAKKHCRKGTHSDRYPNYINTDDE